MRDDREALLLLKSAAALRKSGDAASADALVEAVKNLPPVRPPRRLPTGMADLDGVTNGPFRLRDPDTLPEQ